jgi:hypothetical protein
MSRNYNKPNLDSIEGFSDGYKAVPKKNMGSAKPWSEDPSKRVKGKVKLDRIKDLTGPRIAERGRSHGPLKRKLAVDHLIELIDKKEAWEELSEVWFKQLMTGDYQFFKEFLNRRDGRTPALADIAVGGKIEIKVIYADPGVDGDDSKTSRGAEPGDEEDASL